jgi:hypothetical protein
MPGMPVSEISDYQRSLMATMGLTLAARRAGK